jgi:TPP-dependent pyruvate/acetoin dehydrogenase alpha subunit
MLGRVQKAQKQAANDPVKRQRQRLSISDAERDELERAIDDQVQTAVAAALRSLEARP